MGTARAPPPAPASRTRPPSSRRARGGRRGRSRATSPASSGASGHRVARSRAPRSSSAAGRGLRGERLGAGRGVHETQATGRPALLREPVRGRQSEPRESSKRAAYSAAAKQRRAAVIQPGLVGGDSLFANGWRAPKGCGERGDHPTDFVAGPRIRLMSTVTRSALAAWLSITASPNSAARLRAIGAFATNPAS